MCFNGDDHKKTSYVCTYIWPFPLQVEFRVNQDAPTRPVPVKLWLKQTGKLPLGGHNSNSGSPSYDDRAASYGGCDSPGHLAGCQIIYVKVGCDSCPNVEVAIVLTTNITADGGPFT